ncbi:unnamed protein product [Notodromas monacha]|uniref:Uncharacterized protein n=1 Tax=Notodromas monacha TaxID=399045 RepID=A0A7R9GDY3_9CRUS|nr:unnamed protein product [Notodromas monacha]CAG0919029.1 unnamed protein product [Notodromas monacha]
MGELVTKEWLKQMLEGSGRFGDHNVEICLLESKRALAKGENYMTIPIRCHVVVVVDREEHSLDLFIKILPAGPEHRALAESFKVFQTEALVYNELIPEITKNVESLGLSKECLPNFPRSVFCKGTGDDAVICMEDLGRLGYRLSNR